MYHVEMVKYGILIQDSVSFESQEFVVLDQESTIGMSLTGQDDPTIVISVLQLPHQLFQQHEPL